MCSPSPKVHDDLWNWKALIFLFVYNSGINHSGGAGIAQVCLYSQKSCRCCLVINWNASYRSPVHKQQCSGVSLSAALCQGRFSEQGEQQLLKAYLLSEPQSRAYKAYKEGKRGRKMQAQVNPQFFAPAHTSSIQLPTIPKGKDLSRLPGSKGNHSPWGRKDETNDSFYKHTHANYHTLAALTTIAHSTFWRPMNSSSFDLKSLWFYQEKKTCYMISGKQGFGKMGLCDNNVSLLLSTLGFDSRNHKAIRNFVSSQIPKFI